MLTSNLKTFLIDKHMIIIPVQSLLWLLSFIV
jgi:hypothetical protein